MSEWTLGRWFVLRHAGFPFDWLENLGADPDLDALTEPDAETYARAYARLERVLHGLASRLDVQEAVYISNPGMWENMWRRYVRSEGGATTSSARRVHRQVYTYLQRLCGKNETTSFFGPIGYGRVDPTRTGCELRRDGPVRRYVFVAHWAVTELVRAMRRDRDLLPHLGVTAVATEPLAEHPEPAIRKLAGGSRAFAELADDLGGMRAAKRALDPLLQSGAVELGPSFAAGRADEFDELRHAVTKLAATGAPATIRWRTVLDDLDRLRTEVAAAGFPARVTAMERLEAFFTELTGVLARRAGGTYTDRLVVYEECSSPFSVVIGEPLASRLIARIQEALNFSASYGDQVRRAHLSRQCERWPDGTASLPFAEYAQLGAEDVAGGRFAPYPEVVGRDLPPAEDGPRFALPDICLSAADLSADSFDVVVARVHHHLLLDSWLSVAHSDPADLAAPAREWISRCGEPSGLLGTAVSRRNKGFYVYPGEQVALRARRAIETWGAGPLRAISEFTVHREGNVLVLRDGHGRRRQLYLPLADLAGHPPLAALSAPPVVHAQFVDGDEQPEIRLGDAVYQRKRWRMPAPDIRRSDPAARYTQLRRLARRYDLPRFTYLRTERARKPYVLDTRSPFAAELLAHVAESGEPIQLEPMQPGPDELWLTDTDGLRYTCELRTMATRDGEVRA